MPRLFLVISVLLFALPLSAQRVMLLENPASASPEKIFEGDVIRFKMQGDNFWQEGYIREMRLDIQALVINDRYILLDEIAIIDQGSTLAAAAGYGLMTFGVSWSIWALVGYNTDRDPGTQYSLGDAAVTGISVGTGFLLRKLLGRKRFKPGKRGRRLRLIDITF